MFNSPTVFIIGAGASKELGMPLGHELLSSIQKILNEIKTSNSFTTELYNIVNDFNNCGINQIKLQKEIKSMESGLKQAISIDNYLFTHSSNFDKVTIGKYMIIEKLLQAESGSCLSLSSSNTFSNPSMIEKS
jgi:hypothetical protein